MFYIYKAFLAHRDYSVSDSDYYPAHSRNRKENQELDELFRCHILHFCLTDCHLGSIFNINRDYHFGDT